MSCKKIFDTSSIIMLIDEIKKPECFTTLKELGYKLEIPLTVYGEIRGQFSEVKTLVDEGVIDLLEHVHSRLFLELKDRYPNLGIGELEVLSHGIYHQSSAGDRYYCVLDDDKPRCVAEDKDIIFTGTVGLLNMMCDKGCFEEDEIEDINRKLDNCRVPDDLRIPFY